MKKIINFFGLMGLGIVLFHIFASGAFTRNKAGNIEMDGQLLMQGVSNGLEPYAQSVEKFNKRKGK